MNLKNSAEFRFEVFLERAAAISFNFNKKIYFMKFLILDYPKQRFFESNIQYNAYEILKTQ